MKHGSPEDRGSADRYYGREYSPHYKIGDMRVSKGGMTQEEIDLYTKGYNEETERKEY